MAKVLHLPSPDKLIYAGGYVRISYGQVLDLTELIASRRFRKQHARVFCGLMASSFKGNSCSIHQLGNYTNYRPRVIKSIIEQNRLLINEQRAFRTTMPSHAMFFDYTVKIPRRGLRYIAKRGNQITLLVVLRACARAKRSEQFSFLLNQSLLANCSKLSRRAIVDTFAALRKHRMVEYIPTPLRTIKRHGKRWYFTCNVLIAKKA